MIDLTHPTRLLVFIVYCFICFSGSLEAQILKNIDFTKADSVAALYPNHSLTNLKTLADKLTQPFDTDIEKFRAIYRWVCDNIENDYELYAKNKSRREKLQGQSEQLKQWNKQFNPHFWKKLLYEHKTVCTGYAYLIKELSFHADLTSKIIDGYGRTAESNIGGTGIANHSWNAIFLNNQWYLCDATWSSGSVDPQQKTFIRQFNDAYFLTPPSLFVRNHYPLDSTWLLLNTKPTLHTFLNGPLIYKDLLTYNALPVFPETFQVATTKGKKMTFRFTKNSGPAIKKTELQMVQGTSSLSAYPETNKESDDCFTIDHVFARRGIYVVHLLFNDQYVVTYTVTVAK